MTVLTVPRRVIPVPETVSRALQELIEQGASDVQTRVPATPEEWKIFAAPTGHCMRRIEQARKKFRVTITPSAINEVNCFSLRPEIVKPQGAGLLLGLHGGGFVSDPGEAGLLEAIEMAGLTGFEVVAVDYRMPPDHPFPAAVDDVLAVWKAILGWMSPHQIGVFGTSAGGGLALSLVQRAQSEGLPLPGAIVAGTPWSDLSKTGDSYYTNAGLGSEYEGVLEAAAKLYANGRDLKDPLLSPVYGKFAGFPPTFLITGTRDLFLSNTVRVHKELLRVGVQARLEIQEGESHGQYLAAALADAPEAIELYRHIAEFFVENLCRPTSDEG